MARAKPQPSNDDDVVVGDIVPTTNTRRPLSGLSVSRSQLMADDMPLIQCPTNLDLTTYAGKAALVQAGNPADILMPASGVLELVAYQWLLFPDYRVDPESDEMSMFARLVLWDHGGKHFRTTAAHAYDTMKRICAAFSDDDWRNGIHFVIRVRNSQTPNKVYHDIRVKPPQTAETAHQEPHSVVGDSQPQ